jgi:hypothetical protein
MMAIFLARTCSSSICKAGRSIEAPERLEQTRGGPEPRIERLVNAMFLEKRQLVSGFVEYWGH